MFKPVLIFHLTKILYSDYKKYDSKLVIITDDFFLRDPQIAKEEIDINGTIPINKIFYVFLLYYLESPQSQTKCIYQ
ncbi:MAG: hypothetical protein ACM3VV_02150, partial [Deltaproteobacteria bacterium]